MRLRQVFARLGKARPESQGLLVILEGFVQLSFFTLAEGQQVQDIRILRALAQGFFQKLARLPVTLPVDRGLTLLVERRRAGRGRRRREALHGRRPFHVRETEAEQQQRQAGRRAVALHARAGAFAAAAVVLWIGLPRWPGRAQALLADEVVSAHVRSLMAQHLSDVASTDQHTVRPWFDGKLDFAPPVRDLADQGFPLAGGRLDCVGQRGAAALVYRHRLHVINIFIWPAPSESDARERAFAVRGYNALNWTRSGMTYWAVSDMNASELGQFASLLRGETPRE